MGNTHIFAHKDTHSLKVCSAQWHTCHANQSVITRYGAVVTRHQHSEPSTLSRDVWIPWEIVSSDARLLLLFGTVCSLVACFIWKWSYTVNPHLLGKKRCSFHFRLSLCLALWDYSFHGTSNPNMSFQGPVQHQTEGSVSTSSMVALHPARWFPSFSSLQLEMGLLLWLLLCFIVFDAMTHVERIVSQKPSVLCRQ